MAALIAATFVRAELPPPPPQSQWADWSNSFDDDCPNAMAADSLFDRPAGVHGPIVARNGHFFSGEQRVRFWGMNLAFGANFPTHAQAEAVAHRLARFGINAVRLHHMDQQPFPNGIFADASLTKLSPQSLDRLDYFTAALKRNGIWCDINLHVSRRYTHFHPESPLPPQTDLDKIVDLLDPELIAAQKQYAHDLLTHVNAYTHRRYADEPAVAIVEINNENSLFMWDAKEKLAALPAPYDAELRRQWNRWLLSTYHSRAGLKKAWAEGSEPLGVQMLRDPDFATVAGNSTWFGENHDGAALQKSIRGKTAVLAVSHTDAIEWHVQWEQANLHVVAGQAYTVAFHARADKPVKIGVVVSQAHGSWETLGLSTQLALTPAEQSFNMSFVATQTDDHARLSFTVGYTDAVVELSDPLLAPGGVEGLRADEDPSAGTVAMPTLTPSNTRARTADWYRFLEQTEARYYSSMAGYLRDNLGVKCPITGTIAFGRLPLEAQLGMDFIDAHAYWSHPEFPHKPWDAGDWRITNKPMVDSPASNALFNLTPYRVAGKPFTVTEYNHAAPNEWEADCVPMIASYAAAQDWDGVFLFAYSHGSDFDKQVMQDYFNFEGNPLKMPLVPMGARIFLGQSVPPLPPAAPVHVALDPALGAGQASAGADSLASQTSITYGPAHAPLPSASPAPHLSWTADGAGTGRYTMVDPHAVVFVGFAAGPMPIDLGAISIQSMSTPFATFVLTAADGKQPIDTADRLILTAIARSQNTAEEWNVDRTTVDRHWGHAPEQIEKVVATIRLTGRWTHAYALDPAGKMTTEDVARPAGAATELILGSTPAQAYLIQRN